MKTDTYLSAAKANMYFVLSAGTALVGTVLLSIAGEFIRNPSTIALPVLALAVYGFLHLRNYQYLWFSDEGEKFIFRFHHVHPYMRKRKAIEIPKRSLSNFRIEKKLGGLQKVLILMQEHKGQIIEYPPLSIVLLTAKQEEMILQSLGSQLKKKK